MLKYEKRLFHKYCEPRYIKMFKTLELRNQTDFITQEKDEYSNTGYLSCPVCVFLSNTIYEILRFDYGILTLA